MIGTHDGRISLSFCGVRAELRQHKNETSVYTLLRVYSEARGRGYASGLLQQLGMWADKNGKTLWLEVNQYADSEGMNNQQLEDWYARHGFIALPKTQAGHTIMIRNPRETSQEIHSV